MAYVKTQELPQLPEDLLRLIEASKQPAGNTPAPATSGPLFGGFAAPAPVNVPPAAAANMTPEQIQSVGTSTGDKVLQLMRVLSMITMLVNPLAGGVATGIIGKIQKSGQQEKQKTVDEALAQAKQATDDLFRGRQIGAQETAAKASMKQAETGARASN